MTKLITVTTRMRCDIIGSFQRA